MAETITVLAVPMGTPRPHATPPERLIVRVGENARDCSQAAIGTGQAFFPEWGQPADPWCPTSACHVRCDKGTGNGCRLSRQNWARCNGASRVIYRRVDYWLGNYSAATDIDQGSGYHGRSPHPR